MEAMADLAKKTYVSRLTAVAPAAVAVLLVQGPKSETWILQFWKPNQGQATLVHNRIRYGSWRSKEGEPSESVVVCNTSPNQFEVHCHGGKAAADRIVADLVAIGAALISTSDRLFSQMLPGFHDRISYEASIDLASAKTMKVVSILLDQKRGALRQAIESATDHLRQDRTKIALKELEELESRSELGAHLLAPWRIAIVGGPNVGKSSLINRWLGYDRAIVHSSPGTTRDVLSDSTSLQGWPVELVDMAGIRETDDEIERAGIEAAKRVLSEADLVLELVAPDAPRAPLPTDCKRKILVCTKCDLEEDWDLSTEERRTALPISSLRGEGMELLVESILKKLIPIPILLGTPVPFRPWQTASIRQAIDEVSRGEEAKGIELLNRFF